MQINGTGVATGISLAGEPGTHHLRLTVTTTTEVGSHIIVEDTVTVVVRECKIGEQLMDMGCMKCDEYFYNFRPQSSLCIPCHQDKARCNGMALAPLDGYWHKSSHSDVIAQCLNENACGYTHRTDELMRRAGENITLELTWLDDYPLCNKGYKGILCGTCSDEAQNTRSVQYGKTASLHCEVCKARFWQVLCAVLYITLHVGLVWFLIMRVKKVERNPDNISALSNLSAMIKTLVNFLQMSTTIAYFDVQLSGIVKHIFGVLGWASGTITGHVYFALSCTLQHPHRFIGAILAAAYTPVAIWMGFALFALLCYTLKKKPFQGYWRFIFKVATILLDISYMGMTQKMVQIFYRVSVDLGDGPTWYWAEDTSIQWNSRPHKYLMLSAGIPLLTVVCLGFPVFLIFQLVGVKKKLQADVAPCEYEYFYVGYRVEYAYWEVFVQARKAAIAVISVLSGLLTIEFKGFLAILTLLLAFGLQILCNPWVDVRVNRMEQASLMTCCFMCLFQGAAQSPNLNEVEQQSLLVMKCMVMVGCVFHMVYEILMAHKSLIEDWVKAHEGFEGKNGGLLWVLMAAMHIIFQPTWPYLESIRSRLRTVFGRRGVCRNVNVCDLGIPLIEVS